MPDTYYNGSKVVYDDSYGFWTGEAGSSSPRMANLPSGHSKPSNRLLTSLSLSASPNPRRRGEKMNQQHRNSHGELIAIEARTCHGNPVECLVIYDDAPPIGTSQPAPMLLDAGLVKWLHEQIAIRN